MPKVKDTRPFMVWNEWARECENGVFENVKVATVPSLSEAMEVAKQFVLDNAEATVIVTHGEGTDWADVKASVERGDPRDDFAETPDLSLLTVERFRTDGGIQISTTRIKEAKV